MQSQKWQNDLCSFPSQTIQYHSNPTYAPTSNVEEAEVERFYEDLQDLLELTPKTDVLFFYKGLECKSKKSRDICCKGQRAKQGKTEKAVSYKILYKKNLWFRVA